MTLKSVSDAIETEADFSECENVHCVQFAKSGSGGAN